MFAAKAEEMDVVCVDAVVVPGDGPGSACVELAAAGWCVREQAPDSTSFELDFKMNN